MRAALCAALCTALLLALAAPGYAAGHRKRHRRAAPRLMPVAVSFDAGEPGPTVPSDLLGLSFEVSNLRQIAGYSGGGDLVGLLRSLGTGVLRFGGVSADTRVAWTQSPVPSWASATIGPADLRGLARLAQETGWRVLLTVGFGHFEPEAAAREAAAAKAALGESLEGIEVGNEPNAYALHGLRGEPWTFIQYEEQLAAYRGAIEAAAPGVPLVGPDTSGSSAYESWGLDEAIDVRPMILTGHHYPLGCEQHPPPSISRLLAPATRAAERRSLRKYVSIAQQGAIPFRMDETNSVSCGGTPGISDTFASALWATGYLAQAMSVGVAGVNMHSGSPNNCTGYSPLCVPTPAAAAEGQMTAQPEWYALLLARELVGARPLQTTTTSAGNPNVAAYTFADPDGTLRFVVVDYDPPGKRKLSVSLPAGAQAGGASVLTLTGPSPTALSGVHLGGLPVAANGSWAPLPTLPHAANRDGVVTVTMNPSSAALVTVAPPG